MQCTYHALRFSVTMTHMGEKNSNPWGNNGDYPVADLSGEQGAIVERLLRDTPVPSETETFASVTETRVTPTKEQAAQKELYDEAMSLLLEKLVAARQVNDQEKIVYYEAQIKTLEEKIVALR